MSPTTAWQEVESKVYPAGNGVPSALGAVFLLIGGGGLFVALNSDQSGMVHWLTTVFTGLLAFFGALILMKSAAAIVSRPRVRHAAVDILPDVPTEPVTLDYSIAAGRLMHELIEDSAGWHLRPSERMQRNDRITLFGIGTPLLAVIAMLVSWGLHSRGFEGGWPGAIVAGTVITLLCGGSVIAATLFANRSQLRSLCRLDIPCGEGDLELEIPAQWAAQKQNLFAGLKSAGDEKSHRLIIARQKLLAVQLCPWKFVSSIYGDRTTTRAVQGLLVLTGSEAAPYLRLPILLTADMPGAARLMHQLAAALRVPYLFSANAAGWRLEERLARHRPPITAGGISL